jgi:mono/diheme cytochrome c family protein
MRGAALLLLLLLCVGCGSRKGDEEQTVALEQPVAFEGAMRNEASAKVAHGQRISQVLGCQGCHGEQLEGRLWDDDPKGYGVMWASNLTRSIPAMNDAQIKRLLTTGVHPKGRDLWVMPSELFQHLSTNDLDALVAYLRTLPPRGQPSPDPVLGPRAIAEAKSGQVKPAAALVTELRAEGPADLGSHFALGRYIARVTCAECHGPKLKGREGDTPDLIVASGYSRPEFERLITEGVPTGGRKLKPLMQSVAKGRYSKLTRGERDALYAYLKALAEQPSN